MTTPTPVTGFVIQRVDDQLYLAQQPYATVTTDDVNHVRIFPNKYAAVVAASAIAQITPVVIIDVNEVLSK
jgi:hypothetical protein